MEKMKRLWNRYNMRVVAILLAVVTFLNVPFLAYASVSTPSDLGIDFMGESVEGEYMPDNIISRYEKSFEYCPEMPLSPNSRVAISGGLIWAFIALLAACGIYVGNNTSLVQDIISGFDTYLRRTAGNVKSVMEAWAAFLTVEAGITISGIKQLLPYLRDYLKMYFTGYGTGGFEYSYFSGAGVIKDGPFSPALIKYIEKYPKYQYAFSIYSYHNSNYLIDFTYDTGYGTALAFYLDRRVLKIIYLNEDDKYSSSNPVRAGRTYFPVDNSYTYDANVSQAEYNALPVDFTDGEASALANCLPLPLFKNFEYARGYVQFGKMDGLIEPMPDTSITVPNAWSDLQQATFDRFANTLTLPATEEEWLALQAKLESAKSSEEALDALAPVIPIESGGGTVIIPSVAYSNLSYVITILSGYCGAVLTQGQIDNFISSFYSSNIDGTSALVEEQSSEIVRNFVVINGGSPNPDDDNRNNIYKVLKKLAVSLGVFLIGLGLVSDAPNFDGNPTINNVQVVGDLPNPSPNPNPDSGVDLSGILGFLQSILNVLNAWANPLALMDSLVSKFGLPTISDGIKATINKLPKLISGELTLPELFGNVVDAVFAMPQQVADAIKKALKLETLSLPELFDNLIVLLPDALVEGFALSSLFTGLQLVVGSIPDAIAKLFGLASGFSLNDALNGLGQKISELPNAFAEKFPQSSEPSDPEKEDSEDGGVRKLIKAFLMLMFILVILLIFFLNCLRLITVIFAIPVNTDLFNEDVLAGFEFLKITQIPLFNVSIYALLMGCVYFLVFTSIISLLRKQINHLKIR